MKSTFARALAAALLITLVGCSPPASNISPAANITNSTSAQNVTSQNNSQGPRNVPGESTNTSPAFTFTRSMGPLSTSNVTVPGMHPNPITVTPPGGPTPVGPQPPGGINPGGGQIQHGYSVDVQFVPSQEVFAPGQKIGVKVQLTNTSTDPVFVTLPLSASFSSGTSSRGFAAGSQEEKMAVGEIISYNLTWDPNDGNGSALPGWYFVDYTVTVRAESTPPRQWGSGGRLRVYLVQDPQQAIIKTIDLNQSINVTGLGIQAGNSNNMSLVFTLKQVEMTAKGTSFFVVVTSPESPAPNYEDVEWQLTPVFAQFVADGTVHDARASNTISKPTGIELRWGANGYYLDPVPVGTKELTFRITKMGQRTGPWEFKIPLQ